VLDACWNTDGSRAYACGLDGRVFEWDAESDRVLRLATRTDGLTVLAWDGERRAVYQAGFDATLYTTDVRGSSGPEVALPGKAVAMALSNRTLIVATTGRHVHIFDTRNTSQPLQKRESSLRFATRCVETMSDGLGYITSSIEGRISVEYFSPTPESQARKYAFKCHRSKHDVYAVTALCFAGETFLSGGTDGAVNVWDVRAKKRVKAWNGYPCGVSGLSLSPDATTLAVAASYSFEHGDVDAYVWFVGG